MARIEWCGGGDRDGGRLTQPRMIDIWAVFRDATLQLDSDRRPRGFSLRELWSENRLHQR